MREGIAWSSIGLLFFFQSLSAQQPAPAALVLRGVTVVDVTDGRRLSDRTVVVIGPRIHAVGHADSVPVPQGSRIVDARGKYLLPGFWDMHVHAEANGSGTADDSSHAPIYSLLIANGVTDIREMAQRWDGGADSFRVWQREIMAGTRVGPRGIGPSADLFEGSGITLGTTDDAVRIIDSLKAAGDAFVKYHDDDGDPASFFAVLRAARRVGLPVVGHVPRRVTTVEAADSGMLSIEHVSQYRQCWNGTEDSQLLQMFDSVFTFEKACAPAVQAFIRDRTWLVPTLVRFWAVPAGKGLPKLWENWLRLVRTLHDLGVRRFLAGADWDRSSPPLYGGKFWPGLSVRDELVFLVDVGLTPLEALQAGTLNPASFLNVTDSLGTVAVGKLADLVLLDGDPLADITNVFKLSGVVANGRYFDRAALEELDPVGLKPDVGLAAADRRWRRARVATSGSVTGKEPAP